MMKLIFIILISLFLAGCSLFRLSISEREQLNYSSNENFIAPPKPNNPTIVKAKIKKAYKYQGGDTSLDTWPHHHLILKVITGKIPSKPNTKKFDYHTEEPGYDFNKGQILTFLFTEDGKLWGINEITPHPSYVIIQQPASQGFGPKSAPHP